MTPNRRTVSKDSLLSLDKFQKVKFSPSFSDDNTDESMQDKKSIKYQKQIRLEKLLLKAEYLIDTLKNMLEKTKRNSEVPTVFEKNNSENV
jgi:hypothetical protein